MTIESLLQDILNSSTENGRRLDALIAAVSAGPAGPARNPAQEQLFGVSDADQPSRAKEQNVEKGMAEGVPGAIDTAQRPTPEPAGEEPAPPDTRDLDARFYLTGDTKIDNPKIALTFNAVTNFKGAEGRTALKTLINEAGGTTFGTVPREKHAELFLKIVKLLDADQQVGLLKDPAFNVVAA